MAGVMQFRASRRRRQSVFRWIVVAVAAVLQFFQFAP